MYFLDIFQKKYKNSLKLYQNNIDMKGIKEWDQIIHTLVEFGTDLAIKVVSAVFVYLIGRWIKHWIEKIIHKILDKKDIDISVKLFIKSFVSVMLTILLVMCVIGVLGIQTASFAALIASLGLAVGMSMKDNLSNFAGGVMILMNKPIRVGDIIKAQGEEGKVDSIGILYTILITSDNRTVYIPNGPLSSGIISNNTILKTRSIEFVITINYGRDLEKIKNKIQEIIESEQKVLKNPRPSTSIKKLNNYTADFALKVWANSDSYTEVNTRLKEKLYNNFSELQ